jgi:3-oxoacyl-[acyl-carrier-protein] synthase-3
MHPVASENEFTSGLATSAARKLLVTHNIDPTGIDYLILCTQSPDYFLPTTACLVQAQIGMRTDVGAVDITLSGPGFAYALGLAKGLIESEQVRNVLVVTAETHSRFASSGSAELFGDGAAATLIVADASHDGLNGVAFGAYSDVGPGTLVPSGGLRPGGIMSPEASVRTREIQPNGYDADANRVELFEVEVEVEVEARLVSTCVNEVLSTSGLAMADVDLFVVQDASGRSIDRLSKEMSVPAEKFIVPFEGYGDVGSSTIPIALADAVQGARIKAGDRLILVGVGADFTWGGALVTW